MFGINTAKAKQDLDNAINKVHNAKDVMTGLSGSKNPLSGYIFTDIGKYLDVCGEKCIASAYIL